MRARHGSLAAPLGHGRSWRRRWRSTVSISAPCATALTGAEDGTRGVALAVARAAEGALGADAGGRSRRDRDSWKALLTSRLATGLLVAVFICSDTSLYVAGERATKHYSERTVLFAAAFGNAMIGSLASLIRRGPRGLKDCYNPVHILRVLPVSACFAFAMFNQLSAFKYFDGPFIKLLGQMKLPFAALLSFFVFRRKYSGLQWQIILLMTVACMTFMVVRLGSVAIPDITPLLYVLLWILFNAAGTIIGEKILKKQHLPFTTLMTNMRLGELLTTSIFLLFDGLQLRDFFAGWDRTTWLVVITYFGEVWLSGMMVKRLSSVTKYASKCFSLVVLYSIALYTGRQHFVLTQALGALLIVQSTALFAFTFAARAGGESGVK